MKTLLAFALLCSSATAGIVDFSGETTNQGATTVVPDIGPTTIYANDGAQTILYSTNNGVDAALLGVSMELYPDGGLVSASGFATFELAMAGEYYWHPTHAGATWLLNGSPLAADTFTALAAGSHTYTWEASSTSFIRPTALLSVVEPAFFTAPHFVDEPPSWLAMVLTLATGLLGVQHLR